MLPPRSLGGPSSAGGAMKALQLSRNTSWKVGGRGAPPAGDILIGLRETWERPPGGCRGGSRSCRRLLVRTQQGEEQEND